MWNIKMKINDMKTKSFYNKGFWWQNASVKLNLATNYDLQSNLYKTITLGTTQKWLSWTGGRLIKHLCKMTTNQI